MIGPLAASPADRRLLPEGRVAGPMPWVIAIMMFLAVLTAAAGLALRNAAQTLGSDLADRLTVQIVEADAAAREAQARAAEAALARQPGVAAVRRVPAAEMKALLAPWLGEGGIEDELPLPALIDVDLAAGAGDPAEIAAALARVAPAARVDDHGRALAPLAGLVSSLKWLALALVVLMGAAAAAAVMLAARAALNTHRATIDVMHLLGATDIQIARLFQRRIALDALFGGLVGWLGAVLVIVLLGDRIGAVGSELLGAVALPAGASALLLLLPIGGTLLAMLAARRTVISALRKIL